MVAVGAVKLAGFLVTVTPSDEGEEEEHTKIFSVCVMSV
jgi:hypothetical protein